MQVGGDYVGAVSSLEIAVVDPGSEESVARVPRGAAADVDRAVAAARRAFDTGAWLRVAPRDREKALWRVADLIEGDVDGLAELECRTMGMPFGAAKAQVAQCAATFRYYAGWIERMDGKSVDLVKGASLFHAYTRKEPIGVVGIIVPWNGPLASVSGKLAAALAAGCAAVVKPAEETPLSALRLATMCAEAGVPAGVVNIVTGYGEEAGKRLAEHPDVDKLSFTGSTEVGRAIVRAAAGNMKKLTLELGGKSPMIVFDDADVDRAVQGASNAIFTNAGQVCTAASRLIVHERIFEQLVSGVSERARAVEGGLLERPKLGDGPLGLVAATPAGGVLCGKRHRRRGRSAGRRPSYRREGLLFRAHGDGRRKAHDANCTRGDLRAGGGSDAVPRRR